MTELVPIARPAVHLPTAGGVPWVGANFWSRLGGPLMWRSFDEQLVLDELGILAEHGLTLTRSFFYWPDFHPEPDRVDEELCCRFRRFLDLHAEAGLGTVPTFIVGHMSGGNWDPEWRNGRDLYRDVWMVARQAWFVREMVTRFHDHEAVAGWLVSNEMPLYGGVGGQMGASGQGADPSDVTAWAQLMVDAVRAGGGIQPVSLGDGAWSREITGSDNGFRIRELAPLVDWLGPHSYQMNDDPIRQHLMPAAHVELSHFNRPVVVEEFGVTTDFVSDTGAADYYRQVLHTTLLAGATGWIAWNNTDFDLPDQDPYRHHPFELHFGITTTGGEPKAPLLEMQRFRALLDQLDFPRCRRTDTHTGIVVSSHLEAGYPFWDDTDTPALRDALLQGYISARLADLAPAMIRESEGIAAARLLIVPSVKALSAPGWRALGEAAEAGATVLVSYSCGETPSQRGPWWPKLDDFFGVRKLLRYGLNEPVPEDVVAWRFGEDFGDLTAGMTLSFRAAGTPDGRCMLPVEPDGARVVAEDAHGRPALLVRDTGAGRIVLSTYPVEYFAARSPRVNPDDTVRLYRAAAQVASALPAVVVDDVNAFADVIERQDGRRFALVVSEAGEPLTVGVRSTEPGSRLLDRDGQEIHEVALAPYGVDLVEVST
ncbi:Endo-1,4-beta-mannosidase [Micromonospora rhizosphaerae]|uniref:Endo-1,4-beta-mannosidase n=1 Tax=Micromonospora rhizosphaerae TaxID=568872 RepID=A0A1C6T2U6_9ACTN|nr:cellulase family glycosylhydrolase [Micromonospora rhizosphaerae]SCL36136.1 Endo-1,4-beta-mannosidase [Micromonospora rhizosphaerae]